MLESMRTHYLLSNSRGLNVKSNLHSWIYLRPVSHAYFPLFFLILQVHVVNYAILYLYFILDLHKERPLFAESISLKENKCNS